MMIENGLRLFFLSMHDIHFKTGKEMQERLKREFIHAIDVLTWIKKLSPSSSSFELQASALLHDSERWTNEHMARGYDGDRTGPEYTLYKKQHARESVNFANKILTDKNIPEVSRKRIVFLIEHHDDTSDEIAYINDPELDLLVAADSFSYFTLIAPDMLNREGTERVRNKMRFMVEKMPRSLRQLLAEQHMKNELIELIKSEVLLEFGAL
jgi:hypothetical protein